MSRGVQGINNPTRNVMNMMGVVERGVWQRHAHGDHTIVMPLGGEMRSKFCLQSQCRHTVMGASVR